ncbi:hypothetical protein EZS27_029805 [termite gut metagenome]|uniref:AbiEi antitoxin C-terminal domain-containing protein n=1 Tax=termite gut metagenome TaxID=433724 RepID=A0A5J4QFS1_9ZZZZ
MKIIDIIENQIKKIPQGQVFTYTDFDIEVERKDTIVKTLNNLVVKGKIAKLSKGKFYKPQVTEFGILQPSSYQIVKDFIEKDGELIGYFTGYSVYNDLLLTTQIANVIQIGTNQYRRALKRGNYKISFILQPNPITRYNFRLLQILDAVRFVRDIPATTTDEACQRLIQIFKGFTPDEQEKITKLALQYTDYVRALCGAILETNGAGKSLLTMLDKSLSGVSTYKLVVSEQILPTKTKWRIV